VKKQSKKSGEELQLKTYKSIRDLPQIVWNKIHLSGDYSLLIKEDSNKKELDSEYLFELWNLIYSEYIDEFGLSERFLSIINKKKEIAELQCDFLLSGDKKIRNFVDIARSELESLTSDVYESDFEGNVIYIEKEIGRKIDNRVISVYDYNNYLRHMLKNRN